MRTTGKLLAERETCWRLCLYRATWGGDSIIKRSDGKRNKRRSPFGSDEEHPDFVPLETNPNRYREFHKRFIKVLRSFSDDVIPFSMDEAVVNFSSYHLVYKDMLRLARDIKAKIKSDMGDYFTGSIGIAPNEFLAKLGTELQKPDGLVLITPENINEVLSKLKLTDLPGISKNMALRLVTGGIYSPVQLRHESPGKVKQACKSIIGEFWHYRLNFGEVDLWHDKKYKTMQAMRQISAGQRASV